MTLSPRTLSIIILRSTCGSHSCGQTTLTFLQLSNYLTIASSRAFSKIGGFLAEWFFEDSLYPRSTAHCAVCYHHFRDWEEVVRSLNQGSCRFSTICWPFLLHILMQHCM